MVILDYSQNHLCCSIVCQTIENIIPKWRTAAILDFRLSKEFPTLLRGAWGLFFLFNLQRGQIHQETNLALNGHGIIVNDPTSAHSLLSLLGVLNSVADYVELGRLHLRPLQLYLLALWRPSRDRLSDRIPLRPLFH